MTFREDGGVQFLLAMIVRAQGMDARSGERQHPANILGHHKVPGWPHHMGSQDLSIREGLIDGGISQAPGPLSNPPFGICILLGLDSAKPLHDLLGPFKLWSSQALIVEPGANYIRSCQPGTHEISSPFAYSFFSISIIP